VPVIRTIFKKVYPIDPTVKIPSNLGPNFIQSSGFSIRMPDSTSATILIDKRFGKGDAAKRKAYMNKSQVVGYVLLCAGVPWQIRTEDISSGVFGMSIYTAREKAIAAGSGKVLANGDTKFAISTLYDNIRNAMKVTYKVEGTGKSDGSWQVTGSVGVEKS
jgi:hypothetical protein